MQRITKAAFVLLNLLGQASLLIGRWFNARRFRSQLRREERKDASQPEPLPTRTHVWAQIIRQFRDVPAVDRGWTDRVGLLPKTPQWERWEDLVLTTDADAKELYDQNTEVIPEPKETGVTSGLRDRATGEVRHRAGNSALR
ncbi:hypothetical protein PG996_008336 [Apiospora saccharicola]|uniref:Uncharacterized protein n=1 Tax=Apiospora saccharicola TaxID=335842 RepID=A0ABR1UXM2_9PEZI